MTITGDEISTVDPDGINPVEFSVKSGGEFFSFEDPAGIVFYAIFKKYTDGKSSKYYMYPNVVFLVTKINLTPGHG